MHIDSARKLQDVYKRQVWYCLSDLSDNAKTRKSQTEWNNGWGNDNGVNLYNVSPKDVVNNYYIYSMGNVTYSGAGHTEPTGMAEKKLFVNTMVAAYNAGTKAPSVFFRDDNGNTIDSVYMMYDACLLYTSSYAGRVRTDPEQYPEDFQADQQQDHAGVLLCKLWQHLWYRES